MHKGSIFGIFVAACIIAPLGKSLYQEVAITRSQAQLIAKSSLELHTLQLEKRQLKDKVGRLKEEFIDLDFLDEQARSILGVAGKDEIIIFLGDR